MNTKKILFCIVIAISLVACASNNVVAPTRVPPTAVPETIAPATTVPVATSVQPTPTQSPIAEAPVTSVPASAPTQLAWRLVAIGDSIPYNSQEDCPGCTSFLDRYAQAISEASGREVTVDNLSKHTGLQIAGLLADLKNDQGLRKIIANADIIVVGMSHNDPAWSRDDDPCDGPNADIPDWSKYNQACAAASAEMVRPQFDSLFSQVVALRAGKPTILRTINRYNDWIGWPGHTFSPAAQDSIGFILEEWSKMVCASADEHGFLCGDIYHAFNGADGRSPSGDLLAEDYTHPSDKGNEVIARVLADLGYAPLAP